MPGTTITRRTIIHTAALGAAALAAGGGKAFGQRPAKPPNIVFFLADDLGYADVSCYGAPEIRTPHIDSIAIKGAKFLQAYANSAVCSATRTALITGRYQYRLPVGLEEPIGPGSKPGLPPEHPTLPSLLRKVGYGTTLIGKWHLGSLPAFGPLQSGYDHFYGFRAGALDYFSHAGFGHADLWNDDTPIQQQGYLTDLLGQRAVDTVTSSAKSGKPFLISLHFNAPHWPWEGPDDEAESKRLAGKIVDFDGGTQKTFQSMVEDMDRQIGRVLQALSDSGVADNTIVVFTSDNGGERYSNTWPFSGKKTELLEGGLRIPAVIRWPDHIPAGITDNQMMMSMDWLPTLLAAAGTAPALDYPSDGINLLPSLTANAAPVPRKFFWRYKANAQRAARDGDYKILKIRGDTYLFNVVDDPLERANLKERYPDVYQRLIAEWDAWNRTMLPEVHDSYTQTFTSAEMADHVGAPAIDPKAIDDDPIWPVSPLPSGL